MQRKLRIHAGIAPPPEGEEGLGSDVPTGLGLMVCSLSQGSAALHPGLFSYVPAGNFVIRTPRLIAGYSGAVVHGELRHSKSLKMRLGSDVPTGLGPMVCSLSQGFRCAPPWALFLAFPPGTSWSGLRKSPRKSQSRHFISSLSKFSRQAFHFFPVSTFRAAGASFTSDAPFSAVDVPSWFFTRIEILRLDGSYGLAFTRNN